MQYQIQKIMYQYVLGTYKYIPVYGSKSIPLVHHFSIKYTMGTYVWQKECTCTYCLKTLCTNYILCQPERYVQGMYWFMSVHGTYRYILEYTQDIPRSRIPDECEKSKCCWIRIYLIQTSTYKGETEKRFQVTSELSYTVI
jgi:hypothetical protein